MERRSGSASAGTKRCRISDTASNRTWTLRTRTDTAASETARCDRAEYRRYGRAEVRELRRDAIQPLRGADLHDGWSAVQLMHGWHRAVNKVERRALNDDRRLADGLMLGQARHEGRLRAERRLDWALRSGYATCGTSDGAGNVVRWALRCRAER